MSRVRRRMEEQWQRLSQRRQEKERRASAGSVKMREKGKEQCEEEKESKYSREGRRVRCPCFLECFILN